MAVDIDLLIKAKAVLGTAQTEITKFLDGVNKQTEKIGETSISTGQKIGTFLKGGFMVAAGAVTAFAGVVASATAAVVALGVRGAGLDDVRSAFAQMTKDVGGYDASLRTLRTATDGIVSDTQLMETTNKAFSLGLRLNQDQMKLTGETARVLADRVGVDTASAYRTLSMAMATGMDRQLKSVGLNIDAKKATDDLARSLGIEAGELNESQQIMAKRNAILAAMRGELEATGRAELDFADHVDRAKVMLTNFNDNIAVAIATSPVILELLTSVGDAFMGAFGDNQQSAVQAITGYVNKFAIFLVDVAQIATSTAKYVAFAWGGLKTVFMGILTSVYFVQEAMAKGLADFLEKASMLPGVGSKFEGVAASMRTFATETEGMRQSFAQQTKEAVTGAMAQGRAIDGFNDKLGDMKARMIAAGKTQADGAAIAKAFGDRQKGAAESTEAVNKAADAAAKKIKEMGQAANLAASNDKLEMWTRANSAALLKLGEDAVLTGQKLSGNLLQAWTQALAHAGDADLLKFQENLFKQQKDMLAKSIDDNNQKFIAGLDIRGEALREASDEARKLTMSDYEYQQAVLKDEYDAKVAELKNLNQATDENLSAVQAAYEAKMAGASAAHKVEVEKMKREQNTWANMTTKWLDSIPGLLQAAFTGGGGFGGAMKGLASGMGGDIGNKLFGGPNGLGAKLASGLFGKGMSANMAGKLGGMLGQLGGPLGSMAVNLGMKLGGKLFGAIFGGKDKKATKEVQGLAAELEKTHGGMANLSAISKAVGVDMEAAFKLKGQKGLEEFKKKTEEFKLKFAELKTTFGEWGEEAVAIHAKLPATLTPYLSQLEQMGLLTAEHRAELELWSQDGQVDIEGMKAAADRYGISLSALGGAFQQGVANQNWQQVVDDLKMFENGGADMVAVLAGMGDEISKLVQDSVAFGTTIPKNMEPWIKQLMESGKLVDENGKKIENLDGITFGDPMIAALDKIVAKFDLLLQGLGLIPKAIDAIPTEVNIDVNYDVHGKPDGIQAPQTSDAIDVPGAAAGGLFSKPTFRVIGEAGPEVVGSPNAIVSAFAEAMKQTGAGGSGGGSNKAEFHIHTSIATVDTVRQMFYEEFGPVMIDWLNDNRGGARTKVKQALGIGE